MPVTFPAAGTAPASETAPPSGTAPVNNAGTTQEEDTQPSDSENADRVGAKTPPPSGSGFLRRSLGTMKKVYTYIKVKKTKPDRVGGKGKGPGKPKKSRQPKLQAAPVQESPPSYEDCAVSEEEVEVTGGNTIFLDECTMLLNGLPLSRLADEPIPHFEPLFEYWSFMNSENFNSFQNASNDITYRMFNKGLFVRSVDLTSSLNANDSASISTVRLGNYSVRVRQ